MFCCMKSMQHTETNNIQTNVKVLGLQVEWLTITVNHAPYDVSLVHQGMT